ncbi:hypothetical protein Hamer_G026368, partial [Homarus americanus]
MAMLVSACSIFNTSRNFQIFGWNEVMLACIWLCHPSKELLVRGKSSETWSSPIMSTLSADVCIFEVVYGRISFRWHSLLQYLKCVNHFTLWDECQSWLHSNFQG